MVTVFVNSDDFTAVSRYWLKLGRQNINQIGDFGYQNFKQTVARNYFTWVQTLGSDYHSALVENLPSLKLEVPLCEIGKKHELFSLDESVRFNVATCLLLEFVKKRVAQTNMELLEEPMEGNPPYIRIANRRVTQDTLNATIDYLAIKGLFADFRGSQREGAWGAVRLRTHRVGGLSGRRGRIAWEGRVPG